MKATSRLGWYILVAAFPIGAIVIPTAAEPPPAAASRSAISQAVPDWFQRSIEERTRDGGVWIADNAAYAEEDGGIEAYGMEWRPGIGGRSMIGRLFSLRDGEETATHWEFRTFWHPVEQTVMVYQFGADGTVGWGPLTPGADGGDILEQTFAAPDGTTFRVRHESRTEGDRQVGRSLNWVDGEWQPRRSYTWVLQ